MSQAVITKIFAEWKAQQAIDNQPVVLDEFIFANVPGQDANTPIDNTEGVPVEHIVWRQAVSKSGVVNANSVVYSVTMGADVGNFDFNWIGLANKATGTLAMIIHAPTQSKVKNDSGNQGNVLVRSMLMEYSGAQVATAITTPAETWQINFTARLAGMDEATRLAALDVYGKGAFFDDGFLVTKKGTKYAVTHGLGYVGGLRAQLAADQAISLAVLPVKVWADVCYKGTLTSAYQTEIKFTAAVELDDYTVNGESHFVFAVASVDASGAITDLRPKGSLGDQKGNSDFVRKDKNLSDVKDKAQALENLDGVPKARKINGHALGDDTSITAQDIFDGQAVHLGESADLNNHTTPGLYYQPANVNAQAGKNYPEPNAGSLEIYKHAGVTQIYRVYINSRSYIRSYYNGSWSPWVMQYDKENRPTAAEVNAVSADGGSYNKPFAFGSVKTVPSESNTAEMFSQTGGGGTVVSGVNVQWYDNKFTVGIMRGGSTDTDGFVIQHNGYTRLRIDKDGDLISAANISSGGNVVAGAALYERITGNPVRAYSPNNPQPMNGYATSDWVYQNFITSMDLTAPVDVGFRDGTGYPRGTDGAAMYNFQMVGGDANVGYFVIRYHRYQRNGQWFTLN